MPRTVLRPEIPELYPGYFAKHDIARLVRERSVRADRCLKGVWNEYLLDHQGLALLATGGYGRGELHPFSDIDIVILGSDDALQRNHGAIEAFVQRLWDLGCGIGHSVTGIADCIALARSDISVFTSLMEARLLAGTHRLFDELVNAIERAHIWSPIDFVQAKSAEQHRRHERFNDYAYNLEPHLKEGPGGLRDLQTVLWVARRLFGGSQSPSLDARGLFDRQELSRFREIRRYLWSVRFALHCLAGRAQERLLFDYQKAMGAIFDMTADDYHPHAQVESFMQDHYRITSTLQRLNQRMLQAVRERLVQPHCCHAQNIDAEFADLDGYLCLRQGDALKREPAAVFRLFRQWQRHPNIRGIRADTMRAVRDCLPCIDDSFRANPDCQKLFLELIGPPGTARSLAEMHRHGVLGAYLPAFARISGRMQYDLFHVFTVDQHSLFVIDNIETILYHASQTEFPHARQLAGKLEHPRCLYLAALFHDIAKGRGGDHASLGARDAEEFCRAHTMPVAQTKLVGWLVENHLLLSLTAQKKDTQDPAIVDEFARKVGRIDYLDYLYVLTVADIRGTNPSLWNAWKSQLLFDLYTSTRVALERGLVALPARRQRIQANRAAATELLCAQGHKPEHWAELWQTMPDEYFLRHSAAEIAWHAAGLIDPSRAEPPVVLTNPVPQRGYTNIFIYTDDQKGLFAAVTGVLENLGLNVTEARIITTRDQHATDTFHVLEAHGNLPEGTQRLATIREAILRQLSTTRRKRVTISRRTSRRQHHFREAARLVFGADKNKNRTLLEVFYSDRPGILNAIGQAFADCGIELHDARIATFGNRVEDLFVISTRHGRALAKDDRHALSARMSTYLDPTADEAIIDHGA